ncbi:TPA: UvrD-helicase domain-containing protein, partial [Escherichia coli]|nr:UvrD-helicase domain-containing protein [Escherichia coli]
MSLTPTDEQSAIIHWQGQKLVVNAFAGTGKTSTLVQYALANPGSRMLYLAYNRAVRDEAER